MDNKARKCIFIGYKDNVKGFKLWNLVTDMIVQCRGVVFREDKDGHKHEVTPMEKDPKEIEFELEDEESI